MKLRPTRKARRGDTMGVSLQAAVTLLCGLVAFGQIQLRKIDGHRHVSELLAPSVARAA